MPTKAELQTELDARTAEVAALTARVAELEAAGTPLPTASGSETLPTCYIRVTSRFRFEKVTFRPGMAVMNPSGPMLEIASETQAFSWCSAAQFANSGQPMALDDDGRWSPWAATTPAP
jgi:hypothetical protein